MLFQGPTYNTTMALVTGALMVLAVLFARTATQPNRRSLAGFGWAFVMTGGYLAIFGTHMALTWPLVEVEGAFCCTVDNITFGEPAAFYGMLALVAGVAIIRGESAAERTGVKMDVVAILRPILYVAAIGGFGLILIGIAGMHFGMWRPPDIEPVARLLAGNLLEPLMVMSLYVGTGVAALLTPFALTNKTVAKITSILVWGFGMLWLFVSFTVFYSHIGFFPQPDGTYI
ncbi:putative membrane protein [Trueperella bonasi]|uniref:Membrane protein n=1 Tax=Trueperella bonasi TaxID=312286 RepID=A0ABT9NF50_9ACTO|nr:DUF981 family protein [Trueperella bonasi]MDP9806021.1 putative membrane protein [Trueperella bonasi]